MLTSMHREDEMPALIRRARPSYPNINICQRVLGRNDLALLLIRACLMLSLAAVALSTPSSPAESHDGSLLTKAVVNGSDFNLSVDTGAQVSVIDSASAARLTLPTIGATNLQMVTNNPSVSLAMVTDMQINKTHLRNLKVAVMDLDPMSAAIGSHLDGILGADLLRNFLVTIDYGRDLVGLNPLERRLVGKFCFKLHVFQGSYFLPLRIGAGDYDFLLDTGTNASLMSRAGWSKAQHRKKIRVCVSGIRSANSASPFFVTALNSLTIASRQYKDVPMRVGSMDEKGLLSNPFFDGLLGNDFLEQFIITLDLLHAQIRLRPDPNYRPRPFRYSTIGIQFIRDASESILIVAVWTPSPAEDAGLRIGDRILAIDDVSTRDMSLDEVGFMLHGPAGKRVVLKVQAQAATRKVSLIMRDLLHQLPSHSGTVSRSANVDNAKDKP